MDLINVTINSFYDPDTFRATVKGAGRFGEILTNVPFRMAGINAPERRGATDKERLLMQRGMDLIDDLSKEGKPKVDLNGKMSFGRFHADLYYGDTNVGGALIKAKLAVPYDGSYSVKNFDWDDFYDENH